MVLLQSTHGALVLTMNCNVSLISLISCHLSTVNKTLQNSYKKEK